MLLDIDPVLSSASASSSGLAAETPLVVARDVTEKFNRSSPMSFWTTLGA